MAERRFSTYQTIITAGPGMAEVLVDTEYFDHHGEKIGQYGESMVAFCATWKDVAVSIRHGLALHQCDTDPVKHVSPMVDLS